MVEQFYHNKSILITGSTGFVGKVLLEKILRSLPVVKSIYLAINAKGNGSNAEYGRFKKEIEESQIFDRMKTELGNRQFKELIEKKIKTVAMDMSKDQLGLSDQAREMLIGEVNIIINCAGSVEFNSRLDIAMRINVTGALLLLRLAEQCINFECFCHISTCYAVCDKNGVIEEKMVESAMDWQQIYTSINTMTQFDIEHYQKTLLGNFPNSYTFTKRMAEHLLFQSNVKQIPMLILRPSIIGASLEEPVPGWTDSIALAGGIFLIAGLGLLRELPGDKNNIGDQIPVDLVANQIVVSIPACVQQSRLSHSPLMIVHSSTSSTNPVQWSQVMEYLMAYWFRSPYESRVFNPSVGFYQNHQVYNIAFKIQRKLPSLAAYHIANVVGTKKMKSDMKQLKEAIEKCEEIGQAFRPFTENEWIFDNSNALKVYKMLSEKEKRDFCIDVQKINWKMYMMNHAYGIKRFILKEEAELPSVGYNDVITLMSNKHGENLNPFYSRGKPVIVKTPDQLKQLILNSDDVREAVAKTVRDRTQQYQHKFNLLPNEEKIYKEVNKEAAKMIERISSTYNHSILKYFAQIMKKTFISIYEKIVVNEHILAKLKKMCDTRQGPIMFCPTHRSYIDFLLVSVVLYYYKMEVPHICSGEDFLNIIIVNNLLRSSGAFFMRRTFKGDDLYKAVFKEYVTSLAMDSINLEFFIEGTRSRTNKILYPKYGFLSILTQAYYKGKVKELTFIPVTINYTRTLEGETFPYELTGAEKVKESLSRIVKAVEIFSMNLGSIYLDFCDPINFTEFNKAQVALNPKLQPQDNEKDRMTITNNLGLDIVYSLQSNLRMMPTNLVAAILLLQRKGIFEEELENKVKWLGQTLAQRNIHLSTYGLPSVNTLKIGVFHLNDYIAKTKDNYMPLVTATDNKNLMMLAYYRNPLNQLFFAEGIIIVSLMSCGENNAWKEGVQLDELFLKSCFLGGLLLREEVQQERIKAKNRAFFDRCIELMITRRILERKSPNTVVFSVEAETLILFVSSLIWPMVDSYYVTLLYFLSLYGQKIVESSVIVKKIQWLAEALYTERTINYYEACNIESMKNAVQTFKDMKVLSQKSVFLELGEQFKNNEKSLLELLDRVDCYRNKPSIKAALLSNTAPHYQESLRRQLMSDFTFMAKL